MLSLLNKHHWNAPQISIPILSFMWEADFVDTYSSAEHLWVYYSVRVSKKETVTHQRKREDWKRETKKKWSERDKKTESKGKQEKLTQVWQVKVTAQTKGHIVHSDRVAMKPQTDIWPQWLWWEQPRGKLVYIHYNADKRLNKLGH